MQIWMKPVSYTHLDVYKRQQMAYAGNKEEAEEFKKEVQAAFPGIDIHMDPLSLSVACHIGHGALAVACAKKVTV